MAAYDTAEITPREIDLLNIQWHQCYSSDLSRAVQTAQKVFSGEIVQTSALREVPLLPVFSTNRRLPLYFWNIAGRLAWWVSHPSQPEGKKDTEKRAESFLDMLYSQQNQNILIVSHGFFMQSLYQKLMKRGFNGSMARRVRNGDLYLFEKKL